MVALTAAACTDCVQLGVVAGGEAGQKVAVLILTHRVGGRALMGPDMAVERIEVKGTVANCPPLSLTTLVTVVSGAATVESVAA